ncbi:MAG: flagellar motor switch phosphatase FliY [Syntrophomonadaceae bacterium]|nr:flagellar motor switch phosphatase FliY [Syntrophomonadaceae bacterium]MDD3890046.1 flagellar motor switch phosphatase FliY [Syntrophomonadaceae bacterium]MDD4548235.1 flagellar motor switch phosphatase FliY [Syntrophomonadaceae bacterium]
MNDGILSQEEIDALLKGSDDSTDNTNQEQTTININDFEKDTLGEIGNISMGTAATTLSTILGRKVAITTPDVSITSKEQLQAEYPMPYVVIEVEYKEGLNGANILIMKQEDAAVIANLMMGSIGSNNDGILGEIELSAVGEAMNQMMGSATTSLSSMFNKRIDIAPPALTLVDLGKEHLKLSGNYNNMVAVKFKMEIQDLVDSEIMQIIPLDAVKDMIGMLMGNTTEESTLEAVVEEYHKPVSEGEETLSAAPSADTPSVQPEWDSRDFNDIPSEVKKGEQYTVQPVQFSPLKDNHMDKPPQNIGIIMDVPLDISVELGKTRKTIKEILEINQGSIIQLDRLAGEPVDLLVNGKLVAKGEVVVIDESYGIRITAIISPIDRMYKLQ